MPGRVISFHYKLTNASGAVLDSSEGRQALSFMEGTDQIIPGLEKELLLLKKGDKKKITVPADQAYGQRDEARLVKVPRSKIPSPNVKIGDRFAGGQEAHAPVFVVTAVTENEVTLDGNHELAGMDLTFDVEIVGMRQATSEEISHGHAHGESGHSH